MRNKGRIPARQNCLRKDKNSSKSRGSKEDQTSVWIMHGLQKGHVWSCRSRREVHELGTHAPGEVHKARWRSLDNKDKFF